MSGSLKRIVKDVPMDWLPEELCAANISRAHAGTYSQVVKQMINLTAGIETKRQEEMPRASRQVFILTEYTRWVNIIRRKFPEATVLPYLMYTTTTRNNKVDGYQLYRNFMEGLRQIHNKFNPVWRRVTSGQVSGKSANELWTR